MKPEPFGIDNRVIDPKVIFANTVLLVALSLAPAAFGLGWIYLAGAVVGGAWFLKKNWDLVKAPSRKTVLGCFFASLAQLGLLLTAAMVDAALR